MAVRLTCTDNATGHDGLRWRTGIDSESVDIVVGETAPGMGELVVSEPITPEACFSVAAYSGSEESEAASVCADTIPPPDFSTVQVGDEIEGGVYAGIRTIAGIDYHIIAGKAESEIDNLRWSNVQIVTGADDQDDGMSNTRTLVDSTADSYPAAEYCDSYETGSLADWFLPALNDLTFIQAALGTHPEFSEVSASGKETWSSAENGASAVFAVRMSDGFVRTTRSKLSTGSNAIRTRPIRRVAV